MGWPGFELGSAHEKFGPKTEIGESNWHELHTLYHQWAIYFIL